LKKAKNNKMSERENILKDYGIDSRELTTLDEEINSLMKPFLADLKRLD
jgi:hypothetical protein